MSVRLEQLLAAKPATGPRLFTLNEQRDMARLLIDMGEAVRLHIDHSDEPCEGECMVERKDLLTAFAALLARLDALGKDTA